jgi:hypothetical protein
LAARLAFTTGQLINNQPEFSESADRGRMDPLGVEIDPAGSPIYGCFFLNKYHLSLVGIPAGAPEIGVAATWSISPGAGTPAPNRREGEGSDGSTH